MSSTKVFRSRRRTTCRICGSEDLREYLDLGDQPIANSFIDPEDIDNEQAFPLKVALCESCGLSQLLDVVSAADIFEDYLYLASKSKALLDHYRNVVDAALERLGPAEGALMVDIGCNDGVLLKGYREGQFRLLGVEPSSAGAYAREAGFEIEEAFFDAETGARLAASYGLASIITATNVFAHVDDIRSFADGVRVLLADDGAFIIEFPYLGDMLENCYFDTIYHEHLSYLALTPLTRLFAGTGLRAFRVERTDVGASGPALRLFVCLDASPLETDATVGELLADEAGWGVTSLARYEEFTGRVASVKNEILGMIESLRRDGHMLGGYCAPAKGNTLLNYLGLTADEFTVVSDNNALKIGKLTPGTHIPIVDDEAFLDAGVDHALLLAWNYAEFFLANAEFIKRGGKFIVPLPAPTIRP